ncbi:MAG: hypothetical protein QXT25_04700 [Candidatus Anstonellaceae archaeon]
MWLATSLAAAVAASLIYAAFPNLRKKFRLGFLALMLFGLAILVSIDKAAAFLLEGEPLILQQIDGAISDSLLVGVLMLLPIFLVWAFSAFTSFGRRTIPFEF